MPIVPVASIAPVLAERHYLGPVRRGWGYSDEFGVSAFAQPTARNVPRHWLELTRWCLRGEPNDGTRQWAAMLIHIRYEFPEATTVVSYSDPTAGHTGALYRACGWLWAPTWHRLWSPPTGQGSWRPGVTQAPKDRWIFPLQPDDSRADSLKVQDGRIRRMPWAQYREPTWRRGKFDPRTGGGDYSKFKARLAWLAPRTASSCSPPPCSNA